MELRPLKMTREATWYALRKTGLAKIASSAINCCIPSKHVQSLLQSEQEKKLRRERLIVAGFGEFLIQNAKIVDMDEKVDPVACALVCAAALSGDGGITFAKLFDPHAAELLEHTVSGEPYIVPPTLERPE